MIFGLGIIKVILRDTPGHHQRPPLATDEHGVSRQLPVVRTSSPNHPDPPRFIIPHQRADRVELTALAGLTALDQSEPGPDGRILASGELANGCIKALHTNDR